MFKPKAIYFENKILEYPLGKELMEKYKEIYCKEIFLRHRTSVL